MVLDELYELTGEGMELLDLVGAEDVDDNKLMAFMENWEMDFNKQVEEQLKIVKILESKANAYTPEIERMQKNQKTLSNKADWFKNVVFESMKKTGYKEAGGPTIKAKIVNNGGKLPLIYDVDEKDIPEDYIYTVSTVKVDNEKIREAIEDGEVIEFAHLGERGQRLNIK